MHGPNGKKTNGVFRSLYGLVRAFLKDFYSESKRGTLRHKKGIAIFLAFVLLAFVVMVAGLFKVSETPFFCGLCHNMKIYVDSWKASSHRNVDCIMCHYKPGFVNHLKGKWQDGQLSLVYFITGKSPTRPHAEIDDASCLQSGCHKRADLKDSMVFKNVLFSHPRHIGQMRREMQLRCTTCHSQIVQGSHMTVTDVDCFICHFYKSGEGGSPPTGCRTCHFEARGDITVDKAFVFNHKRYIDRGIKCDRCHTNVISGDGHVPDFACLQCHNKREILEARYTSGFLHRKHVTDHEIPCFTCHSPVKHQITGLHYKGQRSETCSGCHAPGEHVNEVSMYLGKGARLAADRPNRMAIINMDCDVCHRKGSESTPGATCRDCHGDLADGMAARWKKIVKERQEELRKRIDQAKEAAEKRPDRGLSRAIGDAEYNYAFIKKSNGVHNIVYTVEVIEAAKEALQAASVGKGKGAPGTGGGAGEVSCLALCHGGIADKVVPFGSVTFPHEIHVEGEGGCVKCHSPYAQHGQTRLAGCSACHHGKGTGRVRCSDCHRAQEAMFRGKGVKGIADAPDVMWGKAACVQCHVGVRQDKAETAATLRAACAGCHEKEYGSLVDDWMAQNKKLTQTYDASAAALEKELSGVEKRQGEHSVPLRARYDEISHDMQFLAKGGWYHNPQYGEAIAAKIARDSTSLLSMMKAGVVGRPMILKK